jgi:putative endonuclease
VNTDKPYYCYVLWSESCEKFYIGITEDVQKRLKDHNDGISRWTRGRGPWELVWEQKCSDRGAARELENKLKRQKGGIGFHKITGLREEDFGSSGS